MMKFPNAAKGIKRIFTSEILGLIGSILLVVAVVIGVLGIAAGKVGGDTGTSVATGGIVIALIFGIGWMVLAAISFIMNLVGIINASHDESNFKSALFFLIFSIIASILSGTFASTNGMFSSLMYSLSSLMTLFVTIFIISGGVKLADQLNRGDVSTTGTNVLKLIIVAKVIELIVSLIASFMGGAVASVVAGVLFIVAVVLNIVQYFMFLVFLNKAKKMLNE